VSSAAVSMPARKTGRLLSWLSVRHSLRSEVVVVLVLYGIYELGRGLVVGDAAEAHRHARQVVALERWPHLFVEADVQRAAHAVPGAIDLLSVAYVPLHLAVSTGVLLWLHQRRPAAFPFVRTTFLLASGLALVGYVVYPTAPPRLAGVGILDTISSHHFDLNGGLVSALYNPYAAVPSMHIGCALIVAASLVRFGRGRVVRALGVAYPRGRVVRALGVAYPPVVLLIVVATGNHFFFDAAAGALAAGLAVAVAAVLMRRAAASRGAPRSGGMTKTLRYGSGGDHDANPSLAPAGSSSDEFRSATESYQLIHSGGAKA
jgi:PAP2 superfamily